MKNKGKHHKHNEHQLTTKNNNEKQKNNQTTMKHNENNIKHKTKQ